MHFTVSDGTLQTSLVHATATVVWHRTSREKLKQPALEGGRDARTAHLDERPHAKPTTPKDTRALDCTS